MPRDLFGDVVDPSVRVGTRKWYTVPLSLAAHAGAIGAVVVVPLMATGALPAPYDPIGALEIVNVALPAPPPPPRMARPATPLPSPDAAPLEAPDSIRPESGIEALPDVGAGTVPVGLVGGVSIDEVTPPPPPRERPVEPVRVGGRIQTPRKVFDVAPAYPAIAQQAHIEGVVIIEAAIGVDGAVTSARVLRSVPLLDEAALAAVREWRYEPTLLNGVPVPVMMTVTVQFRLR